MGKCRVCGRESVFISSYLSLCKKCILERWEEAKKVVKEVHARSRKKFSLPEKIPKKGIKCQGCGNQCKIPEGKKGYCGLVKNENGKLVRIAGTPSKGLLEWYFDPHVTNCVASWVCPAGTGCGYPNFAYNDGPEYGYYNLAVFYGACNFNCLFCQNWHFRRNVAELSPLISSKKLVEKVEEKVSCVCFFGGDPNPQLSHAIHFSKLIREKFEGRILRVCMETNGNSNIKLLKEFAKIAFESGGSIKIDFKTFEENLNLALCGVSNWRTKRSIRILVKFHRRRPEIPFLHISTLLIPGYVDEEEVEKITDFIAKLDTSIPYSLLAFHPTFLMDDLPFTSRKVAEKCLEIAKKNGLEKVRLGNIHLLI